jgi:hypothetical protein
MAYDALGCDEPGDGDHISPGSMGFHANLPWYMLAMIFIGIWIDRSGIYPGFKIYSFITVILVIIASGFFMANQGSPIMGLTERISGLIGFVWTFLLARKMFTRKGDEGGL